MREKPKCEIEGLCPWETKPKVGMWAPVAGGVFATDCILYKKCPRERWSGKAWNKNPTSAKNLKE